MQLRERVEREQNGSATVAFLGNLFPGIRLSVRHGPCPRPMNSLFGVLYHHRHALHLLAAALTMLITDLSSEGIDTKLSPCSSGLLNVELSPYSTVAEMPPIATLPAAPESQSQSQSDLMDIMDDDELGGWMEEEDQLASDPLDVGGQHEGTVSVAATPPHRVQHPCPFFPYSFALSKQLGS